MLPSSSVAAVPVVNGASEAHLSPIQASSSSVLNFTLQPVMPASLQISASPVLGAALVHPGAGHVSSAAQTAGPKQRKALQNILPARGQVLNGNATPGSLLQQVKEFLNYWGLSYILSYRCIRHINMVGARAPQLELSVVETIGNLWIGCCTVPLQTWVEGNQMFEFFLHKTFPESYLFLSLNFYPAFTGLL